MGDQAQGLRDSGRAKASVGILYPRCAKPRRPGRPQRRHRDDLWRSLSAAVSVGGRRIGMRHLRTLLGDYPHTAALKAGAIRSDRVALDFIPYSPTNKGFKPMVREQAFDVSEMAIVTYLIARSFDKPMVLLPAVVMG